MDSEFQIPEALLRTSPEQLPFLPPPHGMLHAPPVASNVDGGRPDTMDLIGGMFPEVPAGSSRTATTPSSQTGVPPPALVTTLRVRIRRRDQGLAPAQWAQALRSRLKRLGPQPGLINLILEGDSNQTVPSPEVIHAMESELPPATTTVTSATCANLGIDERLISIPLGWPWNRGPRRVEVNRCLFRPAAVGLEGLYGQFGAFCLALLGGGTVAVQLDEEASLALMVALSQPGGVPPSDVPCVHTLGLLVGASPPPKRGIGPEPWTHRFLHPDRIQFHLDGLEVVVDHRSSLPLLGFALSRDPTVPWTTTVWATNGTLRLVFDVAPGMQPLDPNGWGHTLLATAARVDLVFNHVAFPNDDDVRWLLRTVGILVVHPRRSRVVVNLHASASPADAQPLSHLHALLQRLEHEGLGAVQTLVIRTRHVDAVRGWLTARTHTQPPPTPTNGKRPRISHLCVVLESDP